ncbi:hypothetical protein GYMLUDRAFT_42922 [Collybiopsis luxurians FD-317 M1]|uniref:Zn(2)-C6 fungal-type domain-containing protein n=1 Tax=Collybiopsis luxurians FD-317 M1 TaxID=944289 RepID=A0A0D0BZJ5_9AGAR|nr:hypothetical protein GYMLUDRAFT_42922 [Collybiopsis luxurians FD-317 M1]
MPQANRKDPALQRAQDKESKRARGALSCAECRRLKLKCDKTVPCSSCKRRGCSSICPNGVLITGQGTRFVLADTEKLHEKIAQMSDRIRQLEDALTILHSATGETEPHPLLDRESLKIKSSLELHAAIQNESRIKEEELEDSQYIDAFGTLAIREDGASTFYGRSAGSESLLIREPVTAPQETRLLRHDPQSPPQLNGHSPRVPTMQDWQQQAAQSRGLPSVLSNLSHSFPLPSSQPIPDQEFLVRSYLPPWKEALRLCELYLEQAPWFFGAVTRRQLYEELLPMWYAEAPRPPLAPALDSASSPVADRTSTPPLANLPSDIPNGSPTSGLPNGKSGTAHDLALLFMIFCFGALTDENLPAAPDNVQSEHYYDLTKVGLNLEGILDRPPSVATVQTLSLMGIFEGMRSGENSIESTWALMGMATKLAQSIGLHRDCARWGLPPGEVQKRRALFWELFITDCWQSLATGRLATFSLPFVDCELPYDPDQTISEDGTVQPSFPFWKARFGAECVSAVVQGTLTSRAPKYSIILDLDRKVRDMELPKYAQGPMPEGPGLNQTMSHCMPSNYRELTLIYIHRCFFTHAIQSNPTDPIKSQYAPSFLAGYRSACDLLNAVRKQFTKFPAQIARFWVLWTHAFSSTVMISSVVTHGSRSKVAPAALLELKSACELFKQAASHGGRAVKFLPIVQRLLDKAQKVFFETSNGIPPSIPNDIFRPSDSTPDEISVFSGKTHTVTTKVARTTNPRSPAANSSPRNSESPTGSPSQAFTTTNPLFAGVHPSLVQELNGFDGHIAAQLQNAYNNHQENFTEVLMGPRASQATSAQQQQQQQYEAEQLAQQHYEQQQRELEEQQRMEQQAMEERMLHQQEEERRRAAEEEAYAQAQARQQQPHLHYSYTSPTSETSHSIAHGLPAPAPPQDEVMQEQRRTLIHSQSHPNLHQAAEYNEYEQPTQHAASSSRYRYHPQASSSHLHQPYPPPSSIQRQHPHRSANGRLPHSHAHQQQHSRPHPHSHQPPPPPQPQHEMYAIPPEYMSNHQSPASSDVAISPTSSTHSHSYPSPETVFESHPHTRSPVVQGPYWTNGHHAPAPEGTVYGDHPPPSRHGQIGSHQHHQHYPSVPRVVPVSNSHYTPEAAMQGMAAEDPRLQETWQSFMYNVSTPRQLQDLT